MTLIVEDGTGLEDAESYVSVADADTYHVNRNNETWSDYSTAEKEAALRKATQYIDGRWGRRFVGEMLSMSQALCWPRTPTDWPDEIPLPLQHACAELALRAAASELQPDLDRGGAVQSQTVGPLSVTYSDHAPGGKTFPWVERIMARLVLAGGTLARG